MSLRWVDLQGSPAVKAEPPDPSAKENLKSSCSEFRTCQVPVQAESAKNKLWIPCKWDYFGFLYSQMPFLFVCLFVSGCSSHQLF